MRTTIALFCLCMLVALPSPARAAQWQFTGLGGVTFLGRTTLDDLDQSAPNLHVTLGGAATFLTDGIVGVEGVGIFTPRFLKSGATGLVASGRTEALVGNVVLTAPRRFTEYTLRPFISGGIGILRASLQDKPLPVVGHVIAYRANLTGLDIGGGAIGFLSTNVGLRFEARYFSTLNRTDRGAIAIGKTHLSYMTASIGIVYQR